MRHSLLYFFSFLALGTVQAQQSVHRLQRTGLEQGLPHRVVHAIAKDPRGLLWLGTPVGLVRYDGSSFTTITTKHGILDDNVTSVVVDGQGLLWVGHSLRTVNKDPIGIDIVDPLTMRIRSFADHFGDKAPCAAHEITRMVMAPNGTLVLSTRQGHLITYSAQGGFRTIPAEDDTRCGLWLPTANGFIGLVGDTRVSAVYQMLPNGRTLARHPVSGVLRPVVGPSTSEEGACFVLRHAHGNELLRFTPDGRMESLQPVRELEDLGLLPRIPLGHDELLQGSSIHRIAPKELPGPTLFDLATLSPELSASVNCHWTDTLGNTWLGSNFGLFRLSLAPTHFQRYLYQSSIPKGYGLAIRGMGLSGDFLVVNTDMQGAYTVDAKTGQVLAEDRSTALRYSLCVNDDGTYWSWEDPHLVRKRAADQQVLQRLSMTPHEISIWSILPQPDGKLLVGCENGLRSVDPVDGSVGRLERGPFAQVLSASRVDHLLREGEDRIWACTSTGLYRLEGGTAMQRWHKGDPRSSLPVDHVLHAYLDPNGVLWLATLGGGLVRLDPDRSGYRSYSTADGMPSSTVYAVHPDGEGSLWLPTDHGIVRFDTATATITAYHTNDGIAHNEFNRAAHVRGPDGHFYFGGLNGITRFLPQEVRRSERPPVPVICTALRRPHPEQDGLVDGMEELGRSGRIVLPYRARSFQMDLALPDLTSPGDARYAWRLDGIDKDWTEQTDPVLRFNHLPVGDHLLRVRARNSRGAWTEQELRIPIVVEGPTVPTAALVVGGLALLGIGLGVYRYKRRSRQEHTDPAT